VFIEAKDDGGGGDNWTTGAVSRAKLQSNHHQQTNTQHFYRPDALPVAQPTASRHRREHFPLMELNIYGTLGQTLDFRLSLTCDTKKIISKSSSSI